MGLTKRFHGADIPPDMSVAVERDGSVIGYARNEADADRYIAQSDNSGSHSAFFNKKLNGQKFSVSADSAIRPPVAAPFSETDPNEAQRRLRRLNKLTGIMDVFLAERVSNPSAPNIRYVSWEDFLVMHNEYKDAVKHNEHHNFAFQPFSAYVHKILRPGKPPLRPLMQNECGVLTLRDGQSVILVLKDRGPGDVGEGAYYQVKADIGGDE